MNDSETPRPAPSAGTTPFVKRHNFRGENAVFQPKRQAFEQPGGFAHALFQGLTPPEPFVAADTRVVAFGSCFAKNIAVYLNEMGFNITNEADTKAYVSTLGDGMVNSYSILQQFKWALDGWKPTVQTWHGADGTEYLADEDVRERTQELFSAADIFIITLGLSEVWYDEPTGEVFWAGVPADRYDAARHKFRTVTQAENKANIREMIAIIRRHRPEAAIVFTVSPIPLKATFRPISCVVANAASKASIKSALDEVLQEQQAGARIFYFPAYEIVTLGFTAPLKDDLRHPWMHVINVAMTMFERYYCTTGRTDADVEQVLSEARALDAALAAREPGAEDRARSYHMAYKRRGSAAAEFAPKDEARAERREARRQARRAARG